MKNWKTTANGILAALLAIIGPGSALLAALQAISATQPGHAAADYTYAIVGAVLTFLGACARAWIGLIQNDAPTSPVLASVKVTGDNIGQRPGIVR